MNDYYKEDYWICETSDGIEIEFNPEFNKQ